MNKITDFSKQDPEKILAETLVLGKKQMIVKQEMLGQKQALDPAVLPKASSEDWQILKRWGFQKLKDIDDLFCECIFPPGWKKETTSHRMWTDILDERGLARASYFYKAVYYDRRANISINKRFISKNLVGGQDEIDPTVYSKMGIIDISRNNKWLVHVFSPLKIGSLKEEDTLEIKNKIGIVENNTFYYWADSEGNFSQQMPFSAEKIAIIEKNRFYKDYHQVYSLYDTIDAIDNKKNEKVNQWLQALPADDSIWSSKYDFPRIETH